MQLFCYSLILVPWNMKFMSLPEVAQCILHPDLQRFRRPAWPGGFAESLDYNPYCIFRIWTSFAPKILHLWGKKTVTRPE